MLPHMAASQTLRVSESDSEEQFLVAPGDITSCSKILYLLVPYLVGAAAIFARAPKGDKGYDNRAAIASGLSLALSKTVNRSARL